MNFIFFILVLVSTVAQLRRLPNRGIGILVLLVLGAGFFLFPDSVGWVGLFVWLGLLVLPNVRGSLLIAAWVLGDFAKVERIAGGFPPFHPEKRWREQAKVYRELARIARGGDSPEIRHLVQSGHRLAPLIEVELAAIRGDWRSVVTLAAGARARGRFDISTALLELRAFGELGRIDELDRAFIDAETHLLGVGRGVARLYLGAFHGEVRLVDYLCQGELRGMLPEWKRFWGATAAAVAAQSSDASPVFHELSRSGVPAVARAALARQGAPLAPAPPINPELRAGLGEVLLDEERYGDLKGSTPLTVKVLIVLNAAVFLLEEALGGSRNGLTLYRLGAFLPSSVVYDGEWWRFGAALFLHAGLAHLIFNMLALRDLAPFVLRTFGVARSMLVYFGAGMGGLAFITWTTVTFGFEEHLTVGASGGIMGFVGATAAILQRGAALTGSPIARARLLSVRSIIVFQIIFDILVPQTSASAHLSGAALGYVLGRVLHRR